MAKKYFKSLLLGAFALTAFAGCDMSEKFYTESLPETFFGQPKDVYLILERPFTHWQWYYNNAHTTDYGSTSSNASFAFTELTGDIMVVPVRSGVDWADGGSHASMHYHTWTSADNTIRAAWYAPMQGLARALQTKDDLEALDYSTVGLTDADKADHVGQMDALAAFFYKEGLDRFGGLPIYTSSIDELKPRATDKELFEHIEGLLKNAISNLKTQVPGSERTGYITQGVAASLLAQLYLNAVPYGAGDRFAECAALCQEIIDGKYGTYTLETNWNRIYDFNNKTSNELIWAVPSDTQKRPYSTYISYVYTNSSFRDYFGLTSGSPWNGLQIQPSREHLEPHDLYLNTKPWKLGSPYAKFSDGDARKGPFVYEGNNTWKGMFFMETLVNPLTGAKVFDPDGKATVAFPLEYVTNADGSEGKTYKKADPAVLDDYVTRAILDNDEDGKQIFKGWMESTLENAAAYSGYRMVKYPLAPMKDVTTLDGRVIPSEAATRFNAYVPVIRLPEIMYMLAECKMRAGDKAAAATLINNVRKRYFEGGADPNPVTADNLDDYRMLDEWMIEFIDEGAGRRRTDLVRFNKFVTEDWWDHKASNDPTRNRFPIPDGQITANPLMEQNPGY